MANQRVKYPLTEAARQQAIRLVDDWNNGNLSQLFDVIDVTAGMANKIEIAGGLGVSNNYILPDLEILLELSKFNLIFIDTEFRLDLQSRRWQVLLMQELKNAVAGNFEVSDYFLTVNAVGTVINGDNVTFNAPFQSAASGIGNVSQKMSSADIANKLLEILTQDVIKTNSDLANAIHELSTSLENERETKIGKVISQLGRSMQHGANAYAVTQALLFLAQFFR